MFAVWWYAKWTHIDVFASHATFSWFCRPRVCFLGFYVCMNLTFLWERKWGRCAVFATALQSYIWTHLVFMAALAVPGSIMFLGCLSFVSFLWRWYLRKALWGIFWLSKGQCDITKQTKLWQNTLMWWNVISKRSMTNFTGIIMISKSMFFGHYSLP